MLASRREVSYNLHGTADGRVKRSVPGFVAQERREVVVDVRTVDPAFTEIIEMGVHTADVDLSILRQFVVGASSESPARPVIAIFTNVRAAVGGRVVDHIQGRLDIVDAS